MTKKEYLFTCLGEECAEIAKICSKINRFGLKNKNPEIPGGLDNEAQLYIEIVDLHAIIAMLDDCGYMDSKGDMETCPYPEELLQKKLKKLERMMDVSRALGTLSE